MTHNTKKIKEIWLKRNDNSINFILNLKENIEWNTFLNETSYVPFNYSNHRLNYLFEYFSGNNFKILDLSSTIFYENKPAGIIPLSIITTNDSQLTLNTFGLPILSPILRNNLSKKIKKRIFHELITKFKEISKLLKIKKIYLYENFFDYKNGISDWHHELIDNQSKISINYDFFLDLREDITIIKTHLRKSYKNLINKGNDLWDIGVLDANNYKMSHKVFDDFKKLHLRVSGRKTRSDKSWKIQKDSIKENNRFMVYAKEKTNKNLVGAALFTFSKDEVDYEIAAYDRTLFHLPLGHPIQFRAIQKMKELNCKWYRVGELTNIANNRSVSSKKLQIEKFESGFSSNVFPKYLFELKI